MDRTTEVPAVGEFVSDYEASVWFGVGAPKSTPAGFIDRLNTEINLGLADPKVMSRLADQGNSVLPISTDRFGKLIGDETDGQGDQVRRYQGRVKPVSHRFHRDDVLSGFVKAGLASRERAAVPCRDVGVFSIAPKVRSVCSISDLTHLLASCSALPA
jgi:hypothetical protein